MRMKRLGFALVPVTALALTVGAVGFKQHASASTDASGSASSVTTTASGKADGAPCLDDEETLIGKVDGDAYPDKVNDPGHTGTKVTVAWGKKDGSFGKPVSVNDLIGVKKGEVGAVAFADFQNKGKLDALVNIVEPADGDDPNESRVAEFRTGPLDRDGLTSQQTAKSDISKEGEVKELTIANYNKDAYPDVAIRHNGGDGQEDRNVRLSLKDGGLDKFDKEANDKYGDWGTPAEPPSMPTDGWAHFYKSCN